LSRVSLMSADYSTAWIDGVIALAVIKNRINVVIVRVVLRLILSRLF